MPQQPLIGSTRKQGATPARQKLSTGVGLVPHGQLAANTVLLLARRRRASLAGLALGRLGAGVGLLLRERRSFRQGAPSDRGERMAAYGQGDLRNGKAHHSVRRDSSRPVQPRPDDRRRLNDRSLASAPLPVHACRFDDRSGDSFPIPAAARRRSRADDRDCPAVPHSPRGHQPVASRGRDRSHPRAHPPFRDPGQCLLGHRPDDLRAVGTASGLARDPLRQAPRRPRPSTDSRDRRCDSSRYLGEDDHDHRPAGRARNLVAAGAAPIPRGNPRGSLIRDHRFGAVLFDLRALVRRDWDSFFVHVPGHLRRQEQPAVFGLALC